jgi:hypothetical protein
LLGVVHKPVGSDTDAYVSWLQNTSQNIFEVQGTFWRPYQHGLVPASLKPEPIKVSAEQERELLHKSGGLFLRYFTRRFETPTPFWYTACSGYDPKKLKGKTRTQVQRAYRTCRVERIFPLWLSDNGYGCYLAAFAKYRNAQPDPKAKFEAECRGAAGGPFDFWGVFVGDELAGYVKYLVGADYIAGLEMKLDPRYLSLNSSSALQDTVLTTYVFNQHKTVYAGFRSVLHDTNIHDFLLRFGYRRTYCDFKLVYRRSVRGFVSLLYSFRKVADYIPESRWGNRIHALLRQERIRRSFSLNVNIPSREFCNELNIHDVMVAQPKIASTSAEEP